MTLKLLTDHHLEFISLKGGCTGSSESAHVKMPHRWKSHVTVHMYKAINYMNKKLPQSRDSKIGSIPLLYQNKK